MCELLNKYLEEAKLEREIEGLLLSKNSKKTSSDNSRL